MLQKANKQSLLSCPTGGTGLRMFCFMHAFFNQRNLVLAINELVITNLILTQIYCCLNVDPDQLASDEAI